MAAGKIYLVGGSDSHGTTAIVDVFDPIANTWTTGPNLPTPRNNPGAVTLDGKLFVVGGSSNDGSRLATAEEFDPSTNTWTELPPMPTARSYPALVAGPDGRLYAIGGVSLTYGESLSRAVESFDPTTRTWSVQAPLPAPPDTYDQTYYQSGAAVGGGGRIYVLGAGFSSSGRTTRLDAYDPAVNQWTTIQNATNVPSYGNWTAVVAGADGRIYAFRTTVDVYSPISNAWTTVRPVPGIPGQGLGPAAVGPDGRIYLFPVGGFSMYDTEVAVYNPTTNVWIPYPPMPTTRTDPRAVATNGGNVYAIGGIHGADGPVAAVEEYQPATNSWTTRASLPHGRGDVGVAVTASNEILAVGGRGSQGLVANVDLYDPSRDTWTARASLPFAVDDAAAARAADGSIYVAGGVVAYQPYTAVATVERYDPTTDSWSTRAPMLTTRTDFSLVAAPDGKLYAIGGDTGSAYPGTVEAYDPATNQWTWRANLLPPAHFVSAVLGPDGKIYAIGGSVDGTLNATRVDVYDPATDSWTPSTPLPISTDAATAVSSGSNVYVLGGLNSGGGISGALEHGTICGTAVQAIRTRMGRTGLSAGTLPFSIFLPFISTPPKAACS